MFRDRIAAMVPHKQFGMVMTGDDPANWPVDLDVDRILRLVRGYERGASHTIGEDELAAVPWLMMEALVLETAVPISATGSFGRIRGSEFLPMVQRKIAWIAGHAEKLISGLRG